MIVNVRPGNINVWISASAIERIMPVQSRSEDDTGDVCEVRFKSGKAQLVNHSLLELALAVNRELRQFCTFEGHHPALEDLTLE